MGIVRFALGFGPFELSRCQRELRRGGAVLPLGGRALDILIYLVERPGEVVTKQELIDHVWPNVTVEGAGESHIENRSNAVTSCRGRTSWTRNRSYVTS
jgi:DNA-binding response OmpR family regulator